MLLQPFSKKRVCVCGRGGGGGGGGDINVTEIELACKIFTCETFVQIAT